MEAVLTRLVVALIVAASCFMAFKRFKGRENAYAVAWLICAAANAYWLLRLP